MTIAVAPAAPPEKLLLLRLAEAESPLAMQMYKVPPREQGALQGQRTVSGAVGVQAQFADAVSTVPDGTADSLFLG